MAVAWTDITALPTAIFSSLNQTQIEVAIGRAQRRMNEGFWGELYDDGVVYLTAHILVMTMDGMQNVVEQQAGPMRKRGQAPPWSPKWYNGSKWGREYHALLQTLARGPRAI